MASLAGGTWRGCFEELVPEAARAAPRAPPASPAAGWTQTFFEGAFAQDLAVGDAIEGHAAGQAEVGNAVGFAARSSGHLQHDLFGDGLDRGGEVHVPLGDLVFGCGGGAPKRRSNFFDVMVRPVA